MPANPDAPRPSADTPNSNLPVAESRPILSLLAHLADLAGVAYDSEHAKMVLNRLAAQRLEPAYARASLAVLFTAISVAATGYGLWQGMWIGAFGMFFAFCAMASKKNISQ